MANTVDMADVGLMSSEHVAFAFREINAMPSRLADPDVRATVTIGAMRTLCAQVAPGLWRCAACGQSIISLGDARCARCASTVEFIGLPERASGRAILGREWELADAAYRAIVGRERDWGGPPMISAAYPSPVPKPQASTLTVEEPNDEDRFAIEYAQLATKLGVAARPPVRTLVLRNLLAEVGVSVYDLKAVEAYMLSITPPDKVWAWLPVRDVDVGIWGTAGRKQVGREIMHRQYAKPLPLPVLETMASLVERMPVGLVFLVTDIIDVPKPDPFLAVRLKNSTELFVIERWDEPAFRR